MFKFTTILDGALRGIVEEWTQYSKFDGFSSVSSLVKAAKGMGMRAVGITDHGTFAGAIDFLKTCRAEGIRPILGMEAYLARDHKAKGKEGQPDGRRGNKHVNLIAKNFTGFQNVCELSQIASLDGSYYDPRVDFGLLAEYSEGVIATSACLSNVINWNLLIGQYDKAKKCVATFKDIYGDDFYMEIMYHGISAEFKVLPDIQKLAKEMDVKLLATNDCHYVTKDEAEFHEVVMCMSSNRCIRDPNRLKFPYPEFYFKSAEEMSKIFGHIPSSMMNTIEISEKCDYSDIIFVEDGGEMRLPKFDLPKDYDNPWMYLKDLAVKGMRRLGLDKSPNHVKRLKTELMDIKLIYETKKYDFATYFLLVDDIMAWAKEQDIACGIRGSGYGSVLLQCLGITEGVDPIEQDLMWERFLGFDDLMFLSEEDFNIKQLNKTSSSADKADDDASGQMFDRYH